MLVEIYHWAVMFLLQKNGQKGCVTLYKSYKDFKEEEMELTYEYFEEDYHLSLMEDGNYLLVENATIQKI